MTLLKSITALAFAGVIAAVGATPAAATVLYSHPLNNTLDGGAYSNDPGQLLANDFSIAAGGAIDHVSWYGAAFNGLAFSDFTVQFFDNFSGQPGSLLAASTRAAQVTDTHQLDPYGLHLLQFQLVIPTFVADPGETYFLSIADSGPRNFVWANSNTCCMDYNIEGDGWTFWDTQPQASQAFTLSHGADARGGVPEPLTWALMLVGFGGVGAALRARRAVQAAACA